MTTKVAALVSLLVLILVGAYTVSVYQRLPAIVPVHWGIDGQVDDWGPRWMAAGIGLFFMALMVVLQLALPRLTPSLGEGASSRAFGGMMVVLMLMFAYLQVVILLAASHPGIAVDRLITGGICGFLGLVGGLMKGLKRNPWAGIRTKWTMQSEEVWERTHLLASRLTLVAGAVGVLLVLVGVHPLVALLLILAALVYPVVYSAQIARRLP